MEDFSDIKRRFDQIKKTYKSHGWKIDKENTLNFSAQISRTDSLINRSEYSFKVDSEGVERIIEPRKTTINKTGVLFIFLFIILFIISYIFIV